MQYKILIVKEDGERYELADNQIIPNLKVITTPTCRDNIIILHEPILFGSNSIFLLRGIRTEIELKSTKLGRNFYLLTGANCENQKVFIGKDTTAWENISIHLTDKNTSVYIGEDCMFSKDISIWTSDGHAIIDNETDSVINYTEENVYIGDHVWVGANVSIGKGVTLGNNSVVGMGSIVVSKFPANVVVGGNPAKIIREGITWSRYSPSRYAELFCEAVVKKEEI